MGVSLDTGTWAAPPSPLPPLHLGTDRGTGHPPHPPPVPSTVTPLYIRRANRTFPPHSHRREGGGSSFSPGTTSTSPHPVARTPHPPLRIPAHARAHPVHPLAHSTYPPVPASHSRPTRTPPCPPVSPLTPPTYAPSPFAYALPTPAPHPPSSSPPGTTAHPLPTGPSPSLTYFTYTSLPISHHCNYSAHHTVRDIARVFTGYTFGVHIGCIRPCALSE